MEDGASNGKVIAGGRGQGNRLDQLNYPIDVLIDKETNSLFICDYEGIDESFDGHEVKNDTR